MGEAHANVVPEVAALLKDPDPNVRWGAATALRQMGDSGIKYLPK
jgi:HEAT repeat protein